MAAKGLSYGLNLTKRASQAKPSTGKRRNLFDDVESDGETEGDGPGQAESIAELDDVTSTAKGAPATSSRSKLEGQLPKKKQPQLISVYGDLASTLSSKQHISQAEELDANIYDYDAVYDSLKPQKKITQADQEKKPKYMTNLLAAAAVRKRDATIAEEKKLAREREAEGDEFDDKEKFVTSAYKRQQEENRRLEAEEKLREEQENAKNKGRGMTGFYKSMLEKGEKRHEEVVRAVEESLKNGPQTTVEPDKDPSRKTEADLAREINAKRAGAIAINDEGQVVDKRDLLKGGLNVVAKPKGAPASTSRSGPKSGAERSRASGMVGAGAGKQAMRERQTRMMEAQLEQASKRAREDEELEREKIARASKSRKTEGDIMSAKERYLARKREAEEAKKAAG